MLLLQASSIKKYYGDRLILGFDTLEIHSGDKIGVVGANGAGKTTLLQLLAGDIAPDEGAVTRRCPLSYIRQFADGSEAASPVDRRALRELGLADKPRPPDALSGGERTRLQIAAATGEQGLLLLADEPTANLDMPGVELLTERLLACETLVLISHDRALLDRVCNKILEVSGGALHAYPGGYSDYEALRKQADARAWDDYEAYASERTRLENALAERKSKARKVKKAPSRMGNSEARLHRREATERSEKLNSAANAIQSRLDQLEVHEKPRELPQIKLDFSLTHPPASKNVLTGEHVRLAYGDNVLLADGSFIIPNRAKTALVGPNGAGKTTLLNRVADGDETIRQATGVRLGLFRQDFDQLNADESVLQNVLRGSVQSEMVARTILARLLLSAEDVHKPLRVLSGGERVKTAFAKLFVSDANVLLLDEPTNFLDIPAIEALQTMLAKYEGTVLFVSHDRRFVDAVADRLLMLENGRLQSFTGNLTAYERRGSAPPSAVLREGERLRLQMRLTQLLARLDGCGANERQALEDDYARMLEELRKFEQNFDKA